MTLPNSNTKIFAVIAAVMLVAALGLAVTKYTIPANHVNLGSSNSNRTTNSSTNTPTVTKTYTFPGVLPADQIHGKAAKIVTNKGTIIFALDDTAAPKAVSNFVYLAGQGFYDGILWHRVEPGFVIQGGDPNTKGDDPSSWGSGGPGYQFADEPVTGGYTAGTVAMANAGPNTNGSQFFIVLADQPTLPKNYTIFGHVTSGMDVVRSIVKGDVMQRVTIEPAS